MDRGAPRGAQAAHEAGGGAGRDVSADELPPGTLIAVQLDARGGRMHDWLARKVSGAPAVTMRPWRPAQKWPDLIELPGRHPPIATQSRHDSVPEWLYVKPLIPPTESTCE